MKRNLLFPTFASALLACCTCLTPVFGQDQAPEPDENTSTIPLEPEAPTQPPAVAEPVGPRLPLQEGDVLYEGTIEAISFAERRFTLRATSLALPDGTQTPLTLPRYRTVQFDPQQQIAAAPYPLDGTIPRWVSAGLLWTRRAVAVVAPGPETKPVLHARIIEMGEVQNAYASGTGAIPAASTYFNGVREHVAATGLRLGPKLGITELGGVSARPSNPNSDHPRGLALDFMVGRNARRGDAVAAFFEANMGLENVAYIIWKDTLVYPGARTNWAALPVDYGPGMTARHMDHVHVSFLEQPLTPGPWLTADLRQHAKLASRGGGQRAKTSKRKRRTVRKASSTKQR